jgi:uncharacterized protein YigE (DUF2233 family)
MRLLTALVALVVACSAAPLSAQRSRRAPTVHDVWSTPARGLRYLRRTTSTPTQVHVVVADLDAEGVRVVATPHGARWSTVVDFADAQGVEVAVNGGFWGTLQAPRGLAAGGGEVWPNATVDPEFGTFSVDERGRASIHLPDAPPDAAELREAVGGRPVLVLDGALYEGAADFPTAADRAPRTAVGVSREGRRLMLVVVDGRQRDSRGMNLRELAELFVELGADRAINLDGGGSSEMFVRHAGGVVNVPSRGRWEIAVDELLGVGEQTRDTRAGTQVFVRGREREVMNHLGLVAPGPEVTVAPQESSIGGLVPIDAPPPLPPRVRLGTWREPLARSLAVALPASLGLIAMALMGRRFARRAAARRAASRR